MNIIIAAVHKRYDSLVDEIAKISGISVTRVDDLNELNIDYLRSISPRYIFFPHWSWKVPSDIIEGFDAPSVLEKFVDFNNRYLHGRWV